MSSNDNQAANDQGYADNQGNDQEPADNGIGWINDDGTVDPVQFAIEEVGHCDFEDENFQEDFEQACVMYGFKPWEMCFVVGRYRRTTLIAGLFPLISMPTNTGRKTSPRSEGQPQASDHGEDKHECSICSTDGYIDKTSKDGLRVTRYGTAPDNENGPSWINKDGTVDPIEFALAEVGYLDFEDDEFQNDFAYQCAVWGFKPWEMW
ncbi:hypothetical protein FOL47_008166 [Perkinsus chesapeaki]|uniref:Uncharacterized protein n=1 Tax=Perkinsus chesapeaki TaxID=330153 RepID=A0A7J6MU90_PERCH|nr:hypothetical protein FOL47_008166 [Perkinsus chesapeaki]